MPHSSQTLVNSSLLLFSSQFLTNPSSFQSLNQLEIATHIEKTAITMHLDAIRTMKCTLTGTATTKFTDILEAVFGIDEEEVPDLEEEEDEPDTIPEEGLTTKETAESVESTAPEASTSSGTGAKRKAASAPSGRPKRKASKPVKAGVCKLEDATVFYPTSKNNYLHTGVPQEYISKHEGSQYSSTAVYACNYSKVETERGNKVVFCDTVCQNKMQVSSHLRQFHLGICVSCYICNHRWWSAFEWKKHMAAHHPELSEDEYFVAATAPPPDIQIKTEVTEEEFVVGPSKSSK